MRSEIQKIDNDQRERERNKNKLNPFRVEYNELKLVTAQYRQVIHEVIRNSKQGELYLKM